MIDDDERDEPANVTHVKKQDVAHVDTKGNVTYAEQLKQEKWKAIRNVLQQQQQSRDMAWVAARSGIFKRTPEDMAKELQDTDEYREKLNALVSTWRQEFGEPNEKQREMLEKLALYETAGYDQQRERRQLFDREERRQIISETRRAILESWSVPDGSNQNGNGAARNGDEP